MATSLPLSRMRQEHTLNWTSAVNAGLAATVVGTGLLYAANHAGLLHIDVLRMLGGIVVAPGSSPYVAGIFGQLIVGIIFALGYAIFYAETGIDSSWKSGAVLGIAHSLITLALLSFTPGSSWHVSTGESGAIGVAILVLIHMCFGAIVGAFHTDVAEVEY